MTRREWLFIISVIMTVYCLAVGYQVGATLWLLLTCFFGWLIVGVDVIEVEEDA